MESKRRLMKEKIRKERNCLIDELEKYKLIKLIKEGEIKQSKLELNEANVNIDRLTNKLNILSCTSNDDIYISFTKHLFQTKYYLAKYFRVWDGKNNTYRYYCLKIKINGDIFLGRVDNILNLDNMKDHMLGYESRNLIKAIKPWGKMSEVFKLTKKLLEINDLDENTMNKMLSLVIKTNLKKEIESFVEQQKNIK